MKLMYYDGGVEKSSVNFWSLSNQLHDGEMIIAFGTYGRADQKNIQYVGQSVWSEDV